MDVVDFIIPSDKDELLDSQPGKYSVKRIFPLNNIGEVIAGTSSAFQEQGPEFILQHFDEFFSLLVHGSNVKVGTHVLAFKRLHTCLEMFVRELEKVFEKNYELSQEERARLICINKMLAYLLSSFVRHIEVTIYDDASAVQSKRKKTPVKASSDHRWSEITDEILVLIYHWIQLPLEKLWNPPITDGTFVTTIAEICYRILERCKTAKEKTVRESIFQILGTLVKRYNHSISCILRVIQLVKMCDGLAPFLAVGMIQLIEETECTGIVKEILREVERATPEEGGTRNIATFLETLASTNPVLILPALIYLTEHLASQCYLMRNCVIGILKIVVKEVLTSGDLSAELRLKRDECLENLMDHILDSNGFVRSKVLQTWQYLCSEGAVPLVNQNALLSATILRLDDKTSSVRKCAFQLLRTLLQCNPFAAKFNTGELEQQRTQAEKKLTKIQQRIVSMSKSGDKIREENWNLRVLELREIMASIPIEEHLGKNTDEVLDLDAAFEHVRQLMLRNEFNKALELLIKLTSKLPGGTDLSSMTTQCRLDYLLSILHKIFMESQEVADTVDNQTDAANKVDERAKEREKLEEEYESQLRLVEYIKNCLTFANELAKAIPKAEVRLSSTTASEAIEACSFLGVAYQFKINGAKQAVRKALYQVFSRDPSVCKNVADVYSEIYIGSPEQHQSERQKALVIVKALTRILKNLESGESPALAKLVTTWRTQDILGPEVLQVMWERFSLKLTDTSPLESRAALILLSMAATAEPAIVTDNIDVLVTVGLGPRAETDLLLARDTCRALTKVRIESSDPLKCPSRLPNDHVTFQRLLLLLVNKFTDLDESCYTTFSTEAVNVIYYLADQPDILMKELLSKLMKNCSATNGSINKRIIPTSVLANLIHLVGHIAIREMIHLDMPVYKELKRRNMLIEMAKVKRKGDTGNRSIRNLGRKSICDPNAETPSSASRMRRNKDTSTLEDNGEEALEGATADDTDAEFIHNVLENNVLSENGLLSRFVPLVLAVCQHPEQYTDQELQIAASLALSKIMTVSSIFCKEHLQLLITIMERSAHPVNRANILVGITDLMNRFPNEVEPWTKNIYGRLKDESPLVRRTCVKMLSNLILKEMVRVKGQVSELAICLTDPEADIGQEVTQLFTELATKNNALYNIMPDILSRLTDTDLNLEEKKFRNIIKFILGLLQKEKQVDSIIEKICVRFKLSTIERQWRDLAYCLSLLKFNPKSIRRLIDNLNLLKDKIHHEPVLKVLRNIIEQGKKKPETKGVSLELAEKLDHMLDGYEVEGNKENVEGNERVDNNERNNDNEKNNEPPSSSDESRQVKEAAAMPPPASISRLRRSSRRTRSNIGTT